MHRLVPRAYVLVGKRQRGRCVHSIPTGQSAHRGDPGGIGRAVIGLAHIRGCHRQRFGCDVRAQARGLGQRVVARLRAANRVRGRHHLGNAHVLVSERACLGQAHIGSIPRSYTHQRAVAQRRRRCAVVHLVGHCGARHRQRLGTDGARRVIHIADGVVARHVSVATVHEGQARGFSRLIASAHIFILEDQGGRSIHHIATAQGAHRRHATGAGRAIVGFADAGRSHCQCLGRDVGRTGSGHILQNVIARIGTSQGQPLHRHRSAHAYIFIGEQGRCFVIKQSVAADRIGRGQCDRRGVTAIVSFGAGRGADGQGFGGDGLNSQHLHRVAEIRAHQVADTGGGQVVSANVGIARCRALGGQGRGRQPYRDTAAIVCVHHVKGARIGSHRHIAHHAAVGAAVVTGSGRGHRAGRPVGGRGVGHTDQQFVCRHHGEIAGLVRGAVVARVDARRRQHVGIGAHG